MDHNVEQHKTFEANVKRFKEFVYNTTKEDYGEQKFHHLTEGFGNAVTIHLHDEMASLLDLENSNSVELMKIWSRSEQTAQGHSLRFRCQENTFILDGLGRRWPRDQVSCRTRSSTFSLVDMRVAGGLTCLKHVGRQRLRRLFSGG
jgi:hypothetical protein